MTQDAKVLFVLTNHDRLGPAGDESADQTGFHLSEAAEPWQVLTESGITVDLVTPRGGEAPIDPGSYDLEQDANRNFLSEQRREELKQTRALEAIDLDEYSAIYFPGGHGTMWDLPDNAEVQKAIRSFYQSGKPVAAVCHGPAALVNVKLDNGRWLVDCKTVSVFTDSEERQVEKDDVVPFLLASKLAERGAILDQAENFGVAVSVDGHLITGQNPASAKGVGEAIKKAVLDKARKAA